MYFLNLYGQAGILLLNGLANRIIFHPVLLILVSHEVITVLNGFFDLLLPRLCEIELHYRIILELRLSNNVQSALCLRENGESCQVLVCHFQAFKIFDDKIWILPKLNKEILIGLDAFELPIVALEHKVEVDLSITGQLDLDGLGELVLVLHHRLHPQLLRLLQCLNRLRLLLDLDDETVLVTVHHLTSLTHRWVD